MAPTFRIERMHLDLVIAIKLSSRDFDTLGRVWGWHQILLLGNAIGEISEFKIDKSVDILSHRVAQNACRAYGNMND